MMLMEHDCVDGDDKMAMVCINHRQMASAEKAATMDTAGRLGGI